MADSTVAKAFVEIIPSANGIKGNITQVLGGESESAGKLAGLNISSAIKGAIGAAGIGMFLKQAIFDEGGSLQQSIGGVETIFKDSADTVIANADNAFQTAGLSANDYMEQVTSFSASLLQSLDGDTSKAADSANMAIIDMADNANKMGTDMESIQNAYQGFAKQNYTMLDNLKLGYGGTKTEMQRLLKDAEKVSGVKYDISNLNDVYNAIHVIQGEMDITGTTAKEGATTITGSLSAMKAEFSNVMGNLALGRDIGPSLNSLVTTTVTFLTKNLLPAVINIVKALPGALVTIIQTAVPQLLAAGQELISSIGQGMVADSGNMNNSVVNVIQIAISSFMNNLPQFYQQGANMIVNFVNGVLQSLPTIITTVGSIVMTLVNSFLNNLPQLMATGAQMLLNLIQGIIDNLPAIIAAAANVIANLVASIAMHLPEILQTGIEIIGQLVSGLISAIPQIVMNIPTIIASIADAFGQYDWLSIGANIISGIANGISNAVTGLVDSAIKACGKLVDSVKNFFGIASPSKLMEREIGRFIPPGIANGITKNLGSVQMAMDSMNGIITSGVEANVYDRVATGYSYSSSGIGNSAGSSSGFNQTIQIYSPKEMSPSETARQVRNQTRQTVLALKGV